MWQDYDILSLESACGFRLKWMDRGAAKSDGQVCARKHDQLLFQKEELLFQKEGFNEEWELHGAKAWIGSVCFPSLPFANRAALSHSFCIFL